MKTKWIIILTAIGIVIPLDAAATKPVSVELREARYTEEMKGDLDQAIKLYEKIAFNAEADRRYIAEAIYRLGTCYAKKGQIDKAQAQFRQVISRYADEAEFVAKSQNELAKIEGRMDTVVAQAVQMISTCAEGDPRVKTAMESLQGHEATDVVPELIKHLDSKIDTIRRAAIYILWRGQIVDIQPAGAKLIELCKYPEEYTRGMAALALGQNKIGSAYDTLCAMTLSDMSPYARRCGAYALGLLGKPEAKSILEKAAQDSDSMVSGNAKAALEMLGQPTAVATVPNPSGQIVTDEPVVIKTTPTTYADDVSANLNQLSVTFNQVMIEVNFSWVTWDGPFPETTGKPFFDSTKRTCTLPVKLEPGKAYIVGINIGRFNSFQSHDGVTARPYALVFATKGTDGKPTPIPQDLLNRAKQVNDAVASYIEESRKEAATETKTSVQELAIDDGKSAGKLSISGGGHAVKFACPEDRGILRAVKIYGSRYGTAEAPKENFHVWVCDEQNKILKDYSFPYSKFVRGREKWVLLPMGDFAVPKQFVIFVGFNPEQSKGVYVHYDSQSSGKSLKGLPTSPTEDFGTGDWMIRAMVAGQKSGSKSISKSDTISSADLQTLIDSAKPDDTIIVSEGIYTEPIHVTKSVTIRGVNRAGCIIQTTANKPAILVDTQNKGRVNIENLTVKWQLATSDKNTEHPFAVGFKDSKGRIANCSFIPLGNPQQSPVAVQSMGFSDLEITTCRFQGFEYVICFGDGTTGTLEDSLVMDCGHQGVILYTGTKATIQGNVFTGSGYHAVRNTGGTLTLQDNLIIHNKNRGVYLGNKSSSGVIRNNLIVQNATGINGFASSKYLIENNVIVDSSYAGIAMDESCHLRIQNNILQGNELGIAMFARGEAGGNTCGKNTFWKNKKDSDNFSLPADSIMEDPRFSSTGTGDYSLMDGSSKTGRHGLINPEIHVRLWKRWQNRASENEPFGESSRQGTVPSPVSTISLEDKKEGERLRSQAWSFWQQQKFAEAEPLFQQSIEKDPTNANAWNGLGWSQFNLGKPLAAKEAFTACVEIDPKQGAAWNGLGWIAKGQEHVDEAIQSWEQAVRVLPEGTAAMNGLATTYLEKMDYVKAAQYYQMWLKVEPNNGDAKAGLEKANSGNKK